MTEHPLQALGVRSRPLKRAQYEAFAFSLFQGDILVRNESHADPANHEYLVTVEDGVPAACECPADSKYDPACKHRLAVAIRPRILDAVQRLQVAADGGVPATRPPSDEPAEACDCIDRFDGVPCWECMRPGRRSLPVEPSIDG